MDPMRPPLYPVVPPDTDDTSDEDTSDTGLPAHEVDADDSVGAGVMSKGGTSDAATPTMTTPIDEPAFPGDADDEDDDREDDDDDG